MAPTHSRPRLAVVLHADVVGSTALVQKDERVAHERIQRTLRCLAQTVRAYGGIAHEVRGDALLAEFARASDALSAALAFQSTHAEKITALADDIRPVLRIGIALGEVVVADGTLTGSEVVLAQRLEQLSRPGGVTVSQPICQSVPRRLPFAYEDLGARQVKGFEEPVRAFTVTLRPGHSIPVAEPLPDARLAAIGWRLGIVLLPVLLLLLAGALTWWQFWRSTPERTIAEPSTKAVATRPTLAVLPFDNLSADPEQEYFADGISDDLITDLSKISGLLVTARHSAFAFKGKSLDLREIAQQLGVRYVLEGSVRKAGGRVRINAQLTDSFAGQHLWAERYDGQLTDIFDLQDQVTAKIVEAMAVRLTAHEKDLLARRYTRSAEAYDYFLRGQELYFRLTQQDNRQARELYGIATQHDPGFGRAYGAIAITYGREAYYGWAADPERPLERALPFAERAVALDDAIPQTHWALAYVRLLRKEFDHAMAAARRAIATDPNYADGYALLAWIHTFAGQPERALDLMEEALRLNRDSGGVFLTVLAQAQYWADRLDEALRTSQTLIEMNPNLIDGRLYLAAVYSRLGRLAEADWQVQELLLLDPELTLRELAEREPIRDPERLNVLLDDLRRAGLR